MVDSKESMVGSKYRILGQVGQGQFGQVYCGVDCSTDQLVALKDLSHLRSPTRQFLRELRVLVSLQHPNIVNFQALSYNSPGRYLVMDYCEGGTLRELMEGDIQLSLVQRLELLADILQGLVCAHGHDVIHCDLKPENILLSLGARGWVARISDFGIARLGKELHSNAGRGYTGSPAYMAPERFYGQYSCASDLYAVGVILYELVVGERPFSGMPGELMNAHFSQPVLIPETVPSPLRSLISTALKKLPQHRFKSAADMLKSLRRAMEVVLPPPSLPSVSPVSDRTPSHCLPEKIYYEPLSEPVHCLAADSDRIYLGMGGQVICRSYAKGILTGERRQEQQLQLNEPVVQLSLAPQGCLALTRSPSLCVDNDKANNKVNYSLYCLPNQTISASEQPCGLSNQLFPECDQRGQEVLVLKTWHAQSLLMATDPHGQWMAIAEQNVISGPTDSAAPKSQTRLRFWDQEGHTINYPLPTVLDQIIASSFSSNRLFAIERSTSLPGLLLDVYPWKITRIALEVTPVLAVAAPWGYVLTNQLGQLLLMDEGGVGLGKLEVPELGKSNITAIAVVGKSKLIIATWFNGQGQLSLFDLGN